MSEQTEQHPDQAMFWRRLRQMAFTALACLVAIHAVVLVWYREPVVLEALVWADVVIVSMYMLRDGAQTLLERWKPGGVR